MSDLAVTHGDKFLAPLSTSARFTEAVTRHHRPLYDDYTVAKAHIAQAIGDLSDMDVFGRQVLCAVFCRPNMDQMTRPDGTKSTIYTSLKEIKEDWFQHKVVLILKLGPEAFQGDDSYRDAVFGKGTPSPQPGEWLFANANAGIQVNICGEGGTRPQGLDHRGRTVDLFEWEGWPCRIIGDDNFLGRITKPHTVV